jgi:hypothetical protein
MAAPPDELIHDVIDAIAWVAQRKPANLGLNDRLVEDLELAQYQIKTLATPLQRIAQRYKVDAKIPRGDVAKADTVRDVVNITAKAAGFDPLPKSDKRTFTPVVPLTFRGGGS